MKTEAELLRHDEATQTHRDRLLESLPVTEHRYNLEGITTAVLEGGQGPPIILLHGPGETSLWWMQVIPKVVKNYRVIVPDLPGHGSSKVDSDKLSTELVFKWLSELIRQTCPSLPSLVGNILGGSIAARYAVEHGEHISRLVLVDSLGLGKFRPSPRFAFGLFRFMIWPTEKNFNRFFPYCMYDVDDLKNGMGEKWEPFVEYNLECANDKERSEALQFLMKNIGIPKIPDKELEKIDVPTALIWGRHDLANKLSIAETASERYKWPLHIIEESRDDPKLERPEAFTHALLSFLEKQNKRGNNDEK